MGGKDLKLSLVFETKIKIFAEIHNLDNKKTYQENDTLVKMIKITDIYSEYVLQNFNNSIFDATFPSELKNADGIPVFEEKENYRPVSILPDLSKIYERCLYDQMYKYFNHIFSKWQVDFVKALAHKTALLL